MITPLLRSTVSSPARSAAFAFVAHAFLRAVLPFVATSIFVHRPTETLDTPAILKGGGRSPATGIAPDERKKTKQTKFRTTKV